MSAQRLLEGLTPQRLHTSQRSWWDEAFSRFLFEMIPLDAKLIVELDCGLAGAAHTLLPSLPDARYLGVDFNPERLAEAKAELNRARIAPRAELRLAQATALPLDEGAADVVLSIMSLQHREDLPAVLCESARVLKPRGRLIAVEPDNLGQRFYFDGGLEEISDAFRSLCMRARVNRQPADIAIGPRVAKLMLEAGLQHVDVRVHMIHSTRMEPANTFYTRLLRIAARIAEEAGLPAEEERLAACEEAIRRSLFAGLPKRVGFSCHIVPVFLTMGLRA